MPEGRRKKETGQPVGLSGLSFMRWNLQDAYLRGLLLAVLTRGFRESNGLTLVETLEALASDLREVDEQIVAILALNEAVTLVSVEPLDFAFCHSKPSSRPRRGKTKTTRLFRKNAVCHVATLGAHAARLRLL
jgi:hypothetical protein